METNGAVDRIASTANSLIDQNKNLVLLLWKREAHISLLPPPNLKQLQVKSTFWLLVSVLHKLIRGAIMATTTTWISMANSKKKKKETDEEKKRKVPVQTETVQKPTVVVRSWQANQNHHQHFLQSIGQSINKLLLSHYGTQRCESTTAKQRKKIDEIDRRWWKEEKNTE